MDSRSTQRLCLTACLLWLLMLTPAAARATTYATWIMVWNGHDQSAWWNATNYGGAKIHVDGKWQSIDWADNNQVNEYLDNIKRAGVRVVIADLTNGWGWLDTRCQFIQSLCLKKGLGFCVAENSGGNVAGFESHARDIWAHFAGPPSPFPKTYLRYHGKPLIVCYAVRDWFNSYQKSTGPARSRFNLVWASGEDSNKDKWGWQLEPWVGSIPSHDSMFVTSSIKWANTDDAWRKSLAWLDYNFAMAKRQKPAFVIVGSYDDISERNSWLVADTAGCTPGKQMRDPAGALSSTAYYDRVSQWILGRPEVVPGGSLRDGAYRIFSRPSRLPLMVARAEAGPYKGNAGGPGAEMDMGGSEENRAMQGAQAVRTRSRSGQTARPEERGLDGLYWIYHLGHNHYRIIALQSGLSLQAAAHTQDAAHGVELPGAVRQQWDSDSPAQRWTLERSDAGWYRIKNDAAASYLEAPEGGRGHPGAGPLLTAGRNRQEWRFQPVLTLP